MWCSNDYGSNFNVISVGAQAPALPHPLAAPLHIDTKTFSLDCENAPDKDDWRLTGFLAICQNQIQRLFKDFQGP